MWGRRNKQPLTFGSWPGTRISAMLFPYQTWTQSTELRQGYSEIVIKRDKARPLPSTEKNTITVLHTKYWTPPLSTVSYSCFLTSHHDSFILLLVFPPDREDLLRFPVIEFHPLSDGLWFKANPWFLRRPLTPSNQSPDPRISSSETLLPRHPTAFYGVCSSGLQRIINSTLFNYWCILGGLCLKGIDTWQK